VPDPKTYGAKSVGPVYILGTEAGHTRRTDYCCAVDVRTLAQGAAYQLGGPTS